MVSAEGFEVGCFVLFFFKGKFMGNRAIRNFKGGKPG